MTQHHEALSRNQSSPRAVRLASRSLQLIIPILLSLTLIFVERCADAKAQNGVVSDDVIRVRTDLVTIPASVTDARGRRVEGLSQKDFSVRDNGRAVKLEYFAVGTERVAMVFLLDVSGSVHDVAAQQRETALALFSRFGHGSRVAVLRFADIAELAIPFTAEVSRALPAFNFQPLSGRHTAIFDAAAAAVRLFDAPGADTAERRIIILISDGLDTVSATSAATVINEARSRSISFYVLHLPIFAPRDGHLAPRRASKGFRELAEQTGGRYFMIGDVKSALDPHAAYDLAPLFRSIEEDLRGQYVLGYYADDAMRDGRLHHLEISLTGEKGRKLHVRALREGYISKPVTSGR